MITAWESCIKNFALVHFKNKFLLDMFQRIGWNLSVAVFQVEKIEVPGN